jgi:hypothetical protein
MSEQPAACLDDRERVNEPGVESGVGGVWLTEEETSSST